jgi:hypothetical protein
MRLSLVLFCFFYSLTNTFAQDQTVIYRPVFINQCNQAVGFHIWWLHDNNNTYNLDNGAFDEFKVILPDTGRYFLITESATNPLLHLQFDSFGTFRDTFYIKKIIPVIYISNPPFSEYTTCDSLAEGFISDYYYNGNKRMEGRFKNGQPVDSLMLYYRSGILKERYISNPKKHERLTSYYPNGQIQQDYQYSKKETKEYYTNGQLKFVDSHITHNNKSYYINGQLSSYSKKKKQLKFNKDGQLIEKKVRCPDLSFFTFSKLYRQDKIYRYKWSFFNSWGDPSLKIFYYYTSSDSFSYRFPDSLQQIGTYSFDKIYFYQNKKRSHKIEFNSIKEGDEYKRHFILFKKKDQHWIEISKQAMNQLGSTILRLQQELQ